MESLSFADRLNQAMRETKVTAYKISQNVGVGQSTISNYKKGKSEPNASIIKSIAEVLKINSQWLLSGEGNMFIEGNTESDAPVENNNGNKFIKLPNGQYYMTMPLAEFKIQAGFLDHYQDAEFLYDLNQHAMVVDKPVQGRYIAFRVSGDSMDDGGPDAIVANSIVSTRELQRHHWGDKIRFKDFPYWVIYTTQSKMPLLKEIIEHNIEEGYIICHSLNDSPEFADFKLNINDIQAMFYVMDVTKSVSRKSKY